jgi:hypothetical protein
MDHYMGHHGGRVIPLYRDAENLVPNFAPGLLSYLEGWLSLPVAPEDVLAYVAAVVAPLAMLTDSWMTLEILDCDSQLRPTLTCGIRR